MSEDKQKHIIQDNDQNKQDEQYSWEKIIKEGYQPTTDELDENDPPPEDSESE